MEHGLRSLKALPKVMINPDFERMNLLGVLEKGLRILLMQLLVERVNLGPETLILPLALPPFRFRLSLGCHGLASSSGGWHGQIGGQSIHHRPCCLGVPGRHCPALFTPGRMS
jgi:hypothetical protein